MLQANDFEERKEMCVYVYIYIYVCVCVAELTWQKDMNR